MSKYLLLTVIPTALKICNDTEHQKVVELHVSQKCSKSNSFVVTSHLLKQVAITELLNYSSAYML